MRDEFVESYDPTIQGVHPPTLNAWLSLIYFWLEEYRKTVEVDGELTWVSVIFPLAAKPLRVIIPLWVPVCLYVNSSTDILGI